MKEAARKAGIWRAILLLSLISLPVSIASCLKNSKPAARETPVESSIPGGVRAASWAEAERWMDQSGFNAYSSTLRFDGSSYKGNGLYLSSFSFFASGAWRKFSEFVKGGKNPSPIGSPALSTASSFKDLEPSMPNLPPLPDSSALQEAVDMWAQAWCSSSDEALTAQMGDPNPSASFQAENLGSFKSASILWTGKEPNGNGLAKVNVEAEKGKRPARSFSLLLLISNPGAGNPKVTDWGPTGSPEGLAPYAKAGQAGGGGRWNS